jgi:hypothetical protein
MKFSVLLLFAPFFLLGQEHARIVDHSIKYIVYNDERVEIEEYRKIVIKNEKADLFAVYQDYTDQFRKISSVTYDLFDKDGKRIKRLRRADGLEIGFHPSYEINDSKMLLILPEYKQYPYTVEVTSKVKLDGFISFPEWLPRPYFNIAVDHSKLTIVSPIDFPIKYRTHLAIGKSKTLENQIITEYELSDLPHVEKKIRYQDFYRDQPKVLISPRRFKLNNSVGSSNSWVDFGNWFLHLNEYECRLDEQTKSYIDSLKKTDKQRLVEGIYDFMQNRTRYVSIQLGVGGFKSLPTEEVEKNGYGDCKALTMYMKNMLNYAGIKSNFILVKAGNDVPDVIADFPSNQFNHVFLGVPRVNDTIYLECTSQVLPANYVGTFTDDRNVLWIEHDKSSIIRSRVYEHQDNVQTNASLVKLEENGNATIEINMQNQGVLFDEIMLLRLGSADMVKKHNLEKFDYKDFTIKNFGFNQPEKNLPKLDLSYTLKVNGLAKPAGNKLVFPIVPTIPFHMYLLKDDFLKFYSIKRGISVSDEVIVELPNNLWIYNLPEPTDINSDFGRYELYTSFDGKQLKVIRKITFFKGEYNKEKYESFRNDFFQKIEKAESRKLVFNSRT